MTMFSSEFCQYLRQEIKCVRVTVDIITIEFEWFFEMFDNNDAGIKYIDAIQAGKSNNYISNLEVTGYKSCQKWEDKLNPLGRILGILK